MKVVSLLSTLRERDIHLWADGEQLRCNAPVGTLTADLRAQLQQRKDDILEFLRSARELARQQRAIVPLQSRGKRTPIFATAGHNGDVFCYRALVSYLGEEQPFFGLQPPGLDGHSQPLTRVEDLAAYFATQIRAFQPDGPYAIAGYCAGGSIAFELAQQLLRGGAAIDQLALFGSPFPTWYRRIPQLRHRLANHIAWLRGHVRTLAMLPAGARRLYISEKLRDRRAQRTAEPPDPAVIQSAEVGRATVAALRRYVPDIFPGRLWLFFPNKESLRIPALVQWRTVASGTDEYFGVDGCNGDNMLREPYAPTFAELFRQCCSHTDSIHP